MKKTATFKQKKTVLHLAIVLVLLTAGLLLISAQSFAASSPQATGQVNARAGAYLRKSTSTSSKKVAILNDNTSVVIYREVFKSKKSTSAKKIWYYVNANGIKGYIRSDLVDNVRYTLLSGTIKKKNTVRYGAGTKMAKAGTLKKGAKVTVYLDARPVKKTKGKSKVWYRILYKGKYCYVCSAYVKITGSAGQTPAPSASKPAPAPAAQPTPAQVQQVVSTVTNSFAKMTDSAFESYLSKQGFPEAYKKNLRTLHKAHPNWVFSAYNTGLKWNDVLNRQTKAGVSLVHKSYPKSYRSSSKQAEPGWYNASSKVVAYYMDPRNFLNEDRIYMFEDLNYKKDYQTTAVVNKIISGTKLASYGFNANIFMNAGSAYNVSPVFLAARVRQETGGDSVSVNGTKSGGTVVYNPFNIGATGKDPATNGLKYAKKQGWTTPAKAVNGGTQFIASGYISKKQNSIYFQRFNVCNGLSKAGTHQYMTNIMAPYSEAYITKTSYAKYGITNEAITFLIPLYNSMPGSTKLP